jgi:hypothetical protein
MKKSATAFALTAVLCLAVSPAGAALVSFGVHAGLDLNGQDAQELTIEEINGLGTDVTLNYEEIGNPMLLGVHLMVEASPMVDLEFGVEGSFKKYMLLYKAVEHGTDIEVSFFNKEAYFARIHGYVSGKFNLVSLPTAKVFGGAGLNYGLMAPLASRNLITEITKDGNFDLDVTDIIERKGTFGAHVLAGVRLKPAAAPFAILVEGRYYILQENDYGDDTNRFASVLAGFELAF